MDTIDASPAMSALSAFLRDSEVLSQVVEAHESGDIVLIMGTEMLRFLDTLSKSKREPTPDDSCIIAPIGDALETELQKLAPESQRELMRPHDRKRIRILYKHDKDTTIVRTFMQGANLPLRD